jgi:hypothetical protein
MAKSIVNTWKSYREHSAVQHILYNAFRQKPLTLGFTSICDHNHNKIRSSCNDKWNGYNQALMFLQRLFASGKSAWMQQRSNETISNIETILGVEITEDVKAMILEAECL